MQAEPKVVQTAAGPIEVAQWGDGPVVLVLHGTMGGWNQSLVLADALGGPGYRYLAVSRPGYLGTPLESGKSCQAQADLFAALLDALGIAAVGLIAVSGGGPSGLELAVRHPERVWGLVLVSSCATRSEAPAPPAVFGLMAKLTRWDWLRKKMRASMERNLATSAEMFIGDPEVFARTLADPEVGPMLREFLLSTIDYMDGVVAGTKNDVEIMRTAEHALAEIAVPTLVIHGSADRMLSHEGNAKVFEARIPDVELLTIEGGEHGALFTHREQVRAAITSYLRDHAPAAS